MEPSAVQRQPDLLHATEIWIRPVPPPPPKPPTAKDFQLAVPFDEDRDGIVTPLEQRLIERCGYKLRAELIQIIRLEGVRRLVPLRWYLTSVPVNIEPAQPGACSTAQSKLNLVEHTKIHGDELEADEAHSRPANAIDKNH